MQKKLPKKLSEAELREKLRTLPVVSAPQRKLKKVERLVYDFVEHCLGVKSCYVTDLSSIFDFSFDSKDDKATISRAKRRYKVDISDALHDGMHNLVDIANFITKEHKKGLKNDKKREKRSCR